MTRRSCIIYATGIVGALLLIASIPLMITQVFQTLIHDRLKKEVSLAEGSYMIESWKNPSVDIYMQYFFFNISNPDVFQAGGKAAVTQIGPYTYKESRSRENITYLENGTKLLTMSPTSYIFVRDMSVGDPEVDLLRTINIPFVAVMNEMKSYNFFVRPFISMWINSISGDLFLTRTIHEMLWGFRDPLLTRIHSLRPEVDEYFGFMYKKNGSHGGEYVYLTGEQNYMDYGKIHTWNGLSELTWWSSRQSNMINGTDGSGFHPFLSRDELLYIFAAELCRSIHLAYVKDVTVQGIPAYRFAPPADVLASPVNNSANAGFCVPADDCLGTGVMKVSVCQQGAPIVVSFPHFYQAESKYIDAIEGMRPSKQDHETYMDLNPTIGVPVRAYGRAQLNVLLNRVPNFPSTSNLKETIFPIMFINESFVIDDNSAATVRTILLLVALVSNFPLVIMGLGVIFLVVFVILIYRSRQKKEPWTEQETYSQDGIKIIVVGV